MTECNELDEIDKEIIQILQKDPITTHKEIAKQINRPYMTITSRILKLLQKGIVNYQFGMIFRPDKFILVMISLESMDFTRIQKRIELCPYIINAIHTTGKTNFTILSIFPSSLKNIQIEECFRSDTTISHLETSWVLDLKKTFLFHYDERIDHYNELGCHNCLFTQYRKIQ